MYGSRVFIDFTSLISQIPITRSSLDSYEAIHLIFALLASSGYGKKSKLLGYLE